MTTQVTVVNSLRDTLLAYLLQADEACTVCKIQSNDNYIVIAAGHSNVRSVCIGQIVTLWS